jgi:hypothetical protein
VAKSHVLTNQPPLTVEQFDPLLVAEFDEGGNTYLGAQVKTYWTNDETERLVYVFDTDPSGGIIGKGLVRKALNEQDDLADDMPFVGYSKTVKPFRKQGLGQRRLLIMNEASERIFGLPLHSDINITEGAQRIWLHLVEAGLAVEYLENTRRCFHFLGSSAVGAS